MVHFKNSSHFSVISLRDITQYVYMCLLGIFLTVYTVGLISYNIYDRVIKDYQERITNVSKTEGEDINLMCNIINCNSVTVVRDNKNISYVNNNGILSITDMHETTEPYYYTFTNLNKNLLTMVRYRYNTFFVDDTRYFSLVMHLGFLICFIVVCMIVTLSFIKALYEYKANISKRHALSIEMETKLQRELGIALKHELALPIELLKTSTTELYAALYPCSMRNDGMCDLLQQEDMDYCKTCKKRGFNRAVDKIALESFKTIKFTIERLSVVVDIISGTKRIKYSSDDVPIFDILDNVVNSRNSYRLNKFKANYRNVELFKRYSVGLGLNTGIMLNMFSIMVNNAIEAKATEITFIAVKCTYNKLEILIKDNGRGIRDANDNIIIDSSIFNFGYSSKDDMGNQRVNNKWYNKLFSYFGFNNIYVNRPRGLGLSINKEILNSKEVGGDISILETSVAGTTFKLIIPVKEQTDAKHNKV